MCAYHHHVQFKCTRSEVWLRNAEIMWKIFVIFLSTFWSRFLKVVGLLYLPCSHSRFILHKKSSSKHFLRRKYYLSSFTGCMLARWFSINFLPRYLDMSMPKKRNNWNGFFFLSSTWCVEHRNIIIVNIKKSGSFRAVRRSPFPLQWSEESSPETQSF